MSNSWCTIESDPGACGGPRGTAVLALGCRLGRCELTRRAAGVFTELIQHCGAGGVQVEELYALSPEVYAQHECVGRSPQSGGPATASVPVARPPPHTASRPIRGLIFLFKWRKSDYESDARETLWPDEVPHVFFMKQVIHNACATQALLSVLLNAEGVDVGSMLGNFREMTGGMDPEVRAEPPAIAGGRGAVPHALPGAGSFAARPWAAWRRSGRRTTASPGRTPLCLRKRRPRATTTRCTTLSPTCPWLARCTSWTACGRGPSRWGTCPPAPTGCTSCSRSWSGGSSATRPRRSGSI